MSSLTPEQARAAEVERVAEALRKRFGDEHELLRPGVLRGTLWIQAAAWTLRYDEGGGGRNEGDASVRQ